MSFVHFRTSTIGIQLEEALQELLSENVIEFDLMEIVRKEFDKAIVSILKKKVKDKPVIKGQLKHYQNCDNVWMFFVLRPEIRVSSYSLPIQLNCPIKIIACDTKMVSNIGKKKKRKKLVRLKNIKA
mmetsp:Transcript_63085/g.150538  ORF Transcript_63085/g.150538 Transcript_63085/m.150538 type:complete len:127 (+) Transcript_63085:1635-2015(+)